MHFEMHITAFRGLLEAALCTKKQEKTNSGGGGMAPLSAEDAVLVRTAKAKLDTIACLPEQERREPFAAWALGLSQSFWCPTSLFLETVSCKSLPNFWEIFWKFLGFFRLHTHVAHSAR